jgi:apolipoprotein N-acyltransferase
MVDVMAEPVPAPAQAQPTAPRSFFPWWGALAAAVIAGIVALMAFPTFGLWWAAPAGVAMLALAAHRRGFWFGAGLGTIAGLTFLIPLLSWAGGYVGAVWLILPCAFSLYFGLMGGLSALASPLVDRWRWTWPLVTGVMWVLQESLRDRTPFGGFPWGRLAFSQADSPLLRLAVIGGAPAVTFGVAALGGLLAAAVFSVKATRASTGARATTVVRALAPLALALGLVWLPLAVPPATGGGGAYTVAIVQGDVPRLGLDFNAQRRQVLENHVQGTLKLADDVAAGRLARPDLVVWPENASDVDPILDIQAGARIDAAARAVGVPILVGGLRQGPGPKQVQNVGIVWDPQSGPGQTYTKRHPVPFAEYIPMRTFARMITDKVDLVRTDFTAGDTPGVLRVPDALLGDVICFEVAYDEVVRDTVTHGAQLLVVQTNNATFNESEARQQLAMVRLRAVEHGRPALMASTVGISGFVDASGAVFDSTSFNEPAVVVREVELSDTRTMATTLGALVELALVAVALATLVLAVVIRRHRPTGGAALIHPDKREVVD